MTDYFRVTATGLTSRVSQLVVHPTAHDGTTVVSCAVCGEILRQPWPGLLRDLEIWAAAHQHADTCGDEEGRPA